VLVVGGGPAGSATAWFCAQAGLDVVLIDRARFPRAKPCAEYVSPEGARVLSAMGALETLETRAAQLTGMVVTAPSGARIHGEFVARHGFRGFRDRGLGVRREVLDAVLLDRARSAGVHIAEGVKVDDLVRDARGRVTGVRVRGASEIPSAIDTIQSSLLIGADGLRSVVARRLGLAHQSRWPRRIAIVAHFRGVHGMTPLGEMHVTTSGYVGLAPVGPAQDDITNVALVVSAAEARDMAGDAESYLLAWLASHPELARRFHGAQRVSPVRTTGPFASRARRPYADGVALVGDAADFFDPFTGEGIYAALSGGELVAPFVLDAVRADARGDHGAEKRALQAYARARHTTFAGKWRVERLIGTAVSSPALMNGAARVLGRDRELSDLLIGVTGDFVPARTIIRPHTLWRVARAVGLSLTRSIRSAHPAPTVSPSCPTPIPPHVHRS